ncbi:MAG: S1 RNA-binding domain-containing protein [Acidimicrobiia bacterium]|nr:S1 RNA-binding domain-containing protein [Acidimicrobiia bacterium]
MNESRDLVVVDGSNIATEGRAKPSLSQLNDAVMAFLEEHPLVTITVVVDATFGHRIDSSEVKEFESGVANNELVTPPAGAIGRGDAFVLSIANKVGARILSNDSFQEFHGQYDWLFDEGRLIGGKPVPHVGWVFVERLPVRGATSRRSERGLTTRRSGRTKKAAGPTTTATQERAARTQAVAEGRLPPAPPGASGAPVEQPETAQRGRSRRAAQAVVSQSEETPRSTGRSGSRQRGADQSAAGDGSGGQKALETVNDTLPFIEFVENHPVGTSVNAVVESYSSHGAYVMIDDVRGYVPLHLIDDPPPRSARTVMTIGDALTLVVASYSPARRSIDLAFPMMVAATDAAPSEVVDVVAPALARRRSRKATAVPADDTPAATDSSIAEEAAGAQPSRRKRAAKKSVAESAPAEGAVATTSGPRTATKSSKSSTARTSAAKSSAAKTAGAKAAATKSSATKSSATKSSAANVSPAKRPAAKMSTAKASAAKASAAKSSAGRKATAAKKSSPTTAQAAAAAVEVGQVAPTQTSSGTRRTRTKQASGQQRPAEEAPAKKAPAKRAAKTSAATDDGDTGRGRKPRRTAPGDAGERG